MAMKPVDRVFVDTNVLVQSVVTTAPLYAAALTKLHQLRQDDTELWTSRQVLREYVVALTQPQAFGPPLPAQKVIGDVAFLQSTLAIAEDNADVMAQALTFMARFNLAGKHMHDANIVATMQVHGIRKLLTARPADYAAFGGLVIPLPLT
jgi:predicted nucleic acid-binding protein